jgi:signal transduction histidine kinase
MATPPRLDHEKKTSPHKEIWQKRSLFAVRIFLALALGVFVSQLQLDYLESYLYDLRVRFRPLINTSPQHTHLILIKPTTVELLRGKPQAQHHLKLLEKILQTSPKAIIYDMNLETVEGTQETKQLWNKKAREAPHLFALSEELALKGQTPRTHLKFPLDSVALRPGPKSRDVANFAKDGVTRRFLLQYQDQLMVHPFLAQLYRPELRDLSNVRGHFEFLGTKQAYINFRPAGSFPRTSFEAIMEGHFDPNQLANRIVIIGQDLGLAEAEYATTPYSRLSTGMTSVELHGNIFETLIENSSPYRAPRILNLIFICLVSLLTVQVVLTARPFNGLLILLGTFLVFGLFSFVLLWIFGVWISLIHPLLTIFLAYYFFIPYRLIIENRRSWEYYQRNKLLKQVEELKTNFISMMSHDLRTPIARIQGMLEVIIRETREITPLNREAIDTIRASSDELLKFINSILNYAKIESAQVKLNIQSKDINSLIEDVVLKHEFLAKLKQIQIIKELEPLFPLLVDPDLLKQVFSNLIENAIKYSPENTKILISTEDRGQSVVIQVSDQGPGIPDDELPNIFMKFFRSRQTRNSPIKGSGLGLYLAKYFTDLHHGQISVECTPGQGCTFTVEIPVTPL